MRFVKYACVWLAAMLVIVLAVNYGGGFLVNKIGGDTLMPAMRGYARKMTFPLSAPTNEKEEKTVGARLMVRSMLSDTTLRNNPGFFYNFLFCNFTIEQANVYLNADGPHDFSSGIFAEAYHDVGDKLQYVLHPVGLIDLRALSQKKGAEELYRLLRDYPDAEMRLDAYSVSDFKVVPAQITLLDGSGTEITSVKFPEQGDIIREDNCRIWNDVSEDRGSEVCQYLETALRGERDVDRYAKQLAENAPLGQTGYAHEETRYGFAVVRRAFTEVLEGRTGISVIEIRYGRNMLFYCVLLGMLMTVTLLFICFRRR